MKTDFKLSSKMHLFIIISCVVIALGIAVGTICHFAAGGFYNWGADWASAKTVTVTYENIDYSSEKDVKDICEKAFSDNGISSGKVTATSGKNSTGGTLVYEFFASTDAEKVEKAVADIEAKFKSDASEVDVKLSYASASSSDTLPEAGKALWRGAIAMAVAVVIACLYFLIRYGLTSSLAVLLACVHNLALFLSVAALVRVPVGSSVVTFAGITLFITLIGCCFFFDRVRKNGKDDELKKLGAFEFVDKSAGESFKINLFIAVVLCAVSVVTFILTSISSLSPLAVMSPLMLALVCFISGAYGLLAFTPSVYSRFKKIADNTKKKKTAAKPKTDK